MGETFYFGVNNRPKRYEARVLAAEAGEYQATTNAMGQRFEASGESIEAALESLEAAMDKAGWKLTELFTKA